MQRRRQLSPQGKDYHTVVFEADGSGNAREYADSADSTAEVSDERGAVGCRNCAKQVIHVFSGAS